jgi:hypothetical protein
MLAAAIALAQSSDWSALPAAALPGLSLTVGGTLAAWLWWSRRPVSSAGSAAGPRWRVGLLLKDQGLQEDVQLWILPTAAPATRTMIVTVVAAARRKLAAAGPDLRKKDLVYSIKADAEVAALPVTPDNEVIRKIVDHDHPSLSRKRLRPSH